jgi:Tol biopolymer transport system component
MVDNLKRESRIAIYSLETRKLRNMMVRGEQPRWFADGRRVLFFDAGNLYILDISTGRSRQLAELPEGISSFSLSSDDRRIYFTKETREADLWLGTIQ